MTAHPTTVILILLLAAGTYLMRIGGHLILSRFERLGPRAEAALEAVPTAVITALVAPAVFAAGIADAIAAVVTVLAALRLPMIPTLVIAAVTVAVLRATGI
jgi:uncharacterized membrane protein